MAEESEEEKSFGHLTNEVPSDLCFNCGACLASCPEDSLDLENGQLSLVGSCTACGLCYANCPQIIPDQEVRNQIFGDIPASEVGHYKEAYYSRTKSPYIEVVAQDGGFVTSILASLLEEEFIDGAVVMDKDPKWRPKPRVATSRDDLLESAGTKYTPGPILTAARKAVRDNSLSQMALVGTPCQVKALRNMAIGDHAVKEITENVKLILGLFCNKCFSHEAFFEQVLEDQLEMDLSNIAKFDIKDGRFVIYRKGEPKRELALHSLDQFVFSPCELCSDFTAELADISVGNVGSPEGYSTVIVRTDVGNQAFLKASQSGAYEGGMLREVDPGIKHVKKISNQKKERAKKNIDSYKRNEKPLPPRVNTD